MTRSNNQFSPLASQICAGRLVSRLKATIRPEGMPDYTIVFTVRGRGLYGNPNMTGSLTEIHDGAIFLIPPNSPSYTKGITPWDHFWAHFHPRPHWQDLLNWPNNTRNLRILNVPSGTERARIRTLFKKMVNYAQGQDPDREQFALITLEEILLLCRRFQGQEVKPKPDSLITICLEFMAKHYNERITLSDLARRSGQSVSRLSHLCRSEIGLSPIEYLERCRMERAMELLALTSMPISAVARAVGYIEPFYFTRRFKIFTGYSPLKYRKVTSHPNRILRRPDTPLNPQDQRLIKASSTAP